MRLLISIREQLLRRRRRSSLLESPPGDVAVDAADQRLLERHRPVLRYDSQDAFRVASAETIGEGPSNLLTTADGSVIARPPLGGGGRRAGLEHLLRYPDGMVPRPDDRLEEGGQVVADGVRLQEKRRHADRVYGRVVREGRHTWLQYWFWYYLDQKQLLGFGGHEGDWETVQVGLDESGSPELVIFSRHQGALARRWKQIERHRTRAGDHPVVYVAPFSHACYSAPGTHLYLGGIDNPDGCGPAVLPKVEPFGAWSQWPGRWGSSRGILQRWTGLRFLGGRSPASPACQVERWRRPTCFYRSARRWRPVEAAGRALCRLGRPTNRRRPRITARLDRDQVMVSYTMPRPRHRRSRYLYMTIHTPNKRQRVLAARAVRVCAQEGTTTIPVGYAPGRCVVRVSTFNLFRQRGDVQEKELSQCLSATRVNSGPIRRRSVAGHTKIPKRRVRANFPLRRPRSFAFPARGNAGGRVRDPPHGPSARLADSGAGAGPIHQA